MKSVELCSGHTSVIATTAGCFSWVSPSTRQRGPGSAARPSLSAISRMRIEELYGIHFSLYLLRLVSRLSDINRKFLIFRLDMHFSTLGDIGQ